MAGSENLENPPGEEYTLCSDGFLGNVFELATCQEELTRGRPGEKCGRKLFVNEITDRREGSSKCFELTCHNHEAFRLFSSDRIDSPGSHGPRRVNLIIIIWAMLAGLKYGGVQILGATLGIGCVAWKSYAELRRKLAEVLKKLATASKLRAVREVVALSGTNKIAGCFDGSWLTRGFSSLIGVVTLIAPLTKKVIGTKVLSAFCGSCSYGKKKIAPAPPPNDSEDAPGGFSVTEGIDAPLPCGDDCDKNHQGSAGAMEPEGASLLVRELFLIGVWITRYVGDGDSRAYKTVSNLISTLSPDYLIEKLEDTNHFAKRFTTKITSTVRELKLGGAGRLTQKRIKRFGFYVSGNLNRLGPNRTPEMVKSAIMMPLYHAMDDHKYCPCGPDSVCPYQKLKTMGMERSYVQKNPIPVACLRPLVKDFEELSTDIFLKALSHGFSTNHNESFHSLMWKFCLKIFRASLESVEIAVDFATCVWNDGMLFTMKAIFAEFQLNMPNTLTEYAEKYDEGRVSQREDRIETARKKADAARLRAEEERMRTLTLPVPAAKNKGGRPKKAPSAKKPASKTPTSGIPARAPSARIASQSRSAPADPVPDHLADESRPKRFCSFGNKYDNSYESGNGEID